MVNLRYDDVFALRGASYHRAMHRYPLARATEFARLFERFPVAPGETLLDIPSGGGYLARFLPGTKITQLELTPGFGADIPVVDEKYDWPVGEFDHVVCAAALHHVEDQRAFIRRLLSHAKPGGIVHILDVAAGSSVGRFLDEFAGRYNGTGHEGHYLPADLSGLVDDGEIVFLEELPCPWTFDDRDDLLDFCEGLFGLADCPRDALEQALDDYVGIERTADRVRLNWRLSYADLQRV